MRRRCLQFEEAPPNTVEDCDGSLSFANAINSLELSTSATELETSELCHVDSKATSTKQQIVNFPQSTAAMLHPRNSENLSVVSKPLGIGLHLNSIVNAAPMNCIATADHNLGVQDMKLAMTSNNLLENTKNCSMSVSAVEQVSACDGERNVVTKALIVSSISTSELPPTMQEHYAAPDDNRESNSQNTNSLEEHDPPSPRKKRSVSIFLFHIVLSS